MATSGIILETNGSKLAAAVLLRDDDGAQDAAMAGQQGMPQHQGMPPGVSPGDMTLGQAFRQARDQFMAGMASRDGM